MAGALQLPVVDLSSSDRAAEATSIRQACVEYGFFYVINHGLDDGLVEKAFDQSRKFFELPQHEKTRLQRNAHYRGYAPPFAEVLDSSSNVGGDDFKESFLIGPLENTNSPSCDLNQWPSEEALLFWRKTMVSYLENALSTLHRVVATGQERYSVAFFLAPSFDCVIECFETCCSEACPPRFPPITAGEHILERLSTTYAARVPPSKAGEPLHESPSTTHASK